MAGSEISQAHTSTRAGKEHRCPKCSTLIGTETVNKQGYVATIKLDIEGVTFDEEFKATFELECWSCHLNVELRPSQPQHQHQSVYKQLAF